MTKIKLCGLSRPEDITAANELKPDYIGFVFAPKSKRYVTAERAAELKKMLAPGITAVGVFVNETPERIAELFSAGIIDIAQLHGNETGREIERIRELIDELEQPGGAEPIGNPTHSRGRIIQAFQIKREADIECAKASTADFILLDSGAGTGETFDWSRIRRLGRPYFLAGGLHPGNAAEAVGRLHPYAVDVSSGIETDGIKDAAKMRAFVEAVRDV